MRNFFHQALQNSPIRSAWRRVIHLWKPMAGWTLLVWAIIAVILAPLSSAILGLQFFRRGNLIIGNQELLSWALSPGGISYILAGASITLTGWALRFAGLFQIVSDTLSGQPVDIQDILFKIVKRIPLLFRLCLFIVAAGLLLLLPLAAGLGLIYELLLDTYDINYYISETPIEWYLALLASIACFLGWLFYVVYLISRSLMALPVYFHGEKSIRESLYHAWNMEAARSNIQFKYILLVIGLWIIFRLIADTLFFATSSGIINWIDNYISSVRLIALLTGAYIIGSLLLDALISFFAFSHLSALLTELYYRDFDLLPAAPPPGRKFMKLSSYLKKMLQPKRLFTIIGIALLGSVSLSAYMIEQIPSLKRDQPTTIVAHRAGPPPAAENTLDALSLTLQTEAEYAEIDVRLSRDSIVVVAHDPDLMRMAGSTARISETDYDSLQNILTHQQAREGLRSNIYTLGDFLDAARDHIRLMVELKKARPALIEKILSLIRKKKMSSKVTIISMNPNAIQLLQKRAPRIDVGYVSAYSIGHISQLPVELLALNHQSTSPQLVSKAHQQDLEVFAWTVNNAPLMAKMVEFGVDGIITDNPEMGVRVRKEMQQLTTTGRLLLQFQQFVLTEKG